MIESIDYADKEDIELLFRHLVRAYRRVNKKEQLLKRLEELKNKAIAVKNKKLLKKIEETERLVSE